MNRGQRFERDERFGLPGPGSGEDELEFVIELWDLVKRQPQRVLGRARSRQVGDVLFEAASASHPHRRITLRQGRSILRLVN